MAKPNDLRVLLIRSGPNEWDEAGRLVGGSDLPLSPRGRAQIEAEAAVQAGSSLTVILSGPDEGSIASAKAMAEGTGARTRVIPELADISLGLWEGLLNSELAEKCPKTHRLWMEDPGSVVVPEGESVEEAKGRILAALGRALDRYRGSDGAVGVVLRPFALALVRSHLVGGQTKDLWQLIALGPASQWLSIQPRLLMQRGESTRAATK